MTGVQTCALPILARIHTVGSARPFQHRPALNLQTFGFESRDILLAGDYLPLEMASRWHKAFDSAMQEAPLLA